LNGIVLRQQAHVVPFCIIPFLASEGVFFRRQLPALVVCSYSKDVWEKLQVSVLKEPMVSRSISNVIEIFEAVS
jgi:hypothetical protein